MYACLHVKYPLFLSDFNEMWILKKCSNTNFYVNMSGGSRVVPCGRTDRHDEADSRFSQFLRTHLNSQNTRKIIHAEYWKRLHIPQCTGSVTVLSPIRLTYSRRLYLLLQGCW